MATLRDLLDSNCQIERFPCFEGFRKLLIPLFLLVFAGVIVAVALSAPLAMADVTHLPGDDATDKLEAAGTLLKLIDVGIFKWGAKVFAGLLVMSGGWALKEQRFGIAAICVAGAIVIGTTPKWVKNIFDVGDNQGLFAEGRAPQWTGLIRGPVMRDRVTRSQLVMGSVQCA